MVTSAVLPACGAPTVVRSSAWARTGAADRSGARPQRLVNGVEGDSCEGWVGVGLVHAGLGGDGQADHQRGGGDGQGCRDPKAYTPGHRGLLYSMRPRGLGITDGSKPRYRRMVPQRRAGRPRPADQACGQEPESIMMPAGTEASRLSPPEA